MTTIQTKNGKINTHFVNAWHSSRMISHGRNVKIYTFKWLNKGKAAKDYFTRVKAVLQFYKISYLWGNDAVRGGQEGQHFIISKRGYNKINKSMCAEYFNNK